MTTRPEDPAAARFVLVATDGEMARVRKTFALPGQAGHEARWLAEAHHPGVVRLVAHSDRHLDTELVVGPTLRTAGLSPDEAATVLASVARTLAELHDRGLVHANVSPDHILVVSSKEAAGAPPARLCSPRGPSVDHPDHRSARHDDHRVHGGPDSVGLGGCVRWLVDDWAGREIPVPRAWAELAATVEVRGEQLTMRRLLHRIAELGPLPDPRIPDRTVPDRTVPNRTVPNRTVPDHTVPDPTIPGTPARRAFRALSFVLSIAFAGLFIVRPGGPLRPVDRNTGATPKTAVSDPAASIVLDGARYALDAQAEREFLTADVDQPCPGQPRLIVLETGNDVVWAFHDIGDQAEAVPMGRVVGATGLHVEPAGISGGCPRLWATGPAGRADLSKAQP